MDANEFSDKSVGGGVRKRYEKLRKKSSTFITAQHDNLIEFLNIHIDVSYFRYGYRTSCSLIGDTFVSYLRFWFDATNAQSLSQSPRLNSSITAERRTPILVSPLVLMNKTHIQTDILHASRCAPTRSS